MGLLDIFKEKKTPLDAIKNSFRFLTLDYGFYLVTTEDRKDFKAEHFLVYRNDYSKLQLEICGDTNWFHCEIRRVINGEPAKYSDQENCIGFEDLAILESNYDYNHFDYYAFGGTGFEGVLRNTVKLFKRYKTFLTTDNWIDVKKIRQIKDEDFQKWAGNRIVPSPRAFFEELKKQAIALLKESGYNLLIDSDELSPFDSSGMVHHLTCEKGNKQIRITQVDWRDVYYMYQIEVNDKKVFEIDISDLEIDVSVARLLKGLKQQL